ncbi:TRAP transporter small permease [Bacillus sp. B15-48]|uniref:TRAP transporter small permease n=1 Tax=Bacillus sp. B15-48 TaxID=1548601 RepID=UPI00193FBF09|nr:TRAP transporter small permease [Bacillus sp. B15-48]MBM4763837.1 TRAP transporter small permease subunit [Bacillus sp. B15-48]
MATNWRKVPIEGYVCFILLMAISIVMGMEIVARYVFSNSFRWAGELSRYLFIWFTFVGASYAIIENSHIKIEALKMAFPEKVRPYLEMVGNILWFLFSVFIAYIGFKYSINLLGSNNTSTAMQIPIGIVYISIPIGYTLMAFRLLWLAIKEFKYGTLSKG